MSLRVNWYVPFSFVKAKSYQQWNWSVIWLFCANLYKRLVFDVFTWDDNSELKSQLDIRQDMTKGGFSINDSKDKRDNGTN